MNFSKKIINAIVPYYRSFIQIELNEKVFVLPSINSVVWFFDATTYIEISELDELNKLIFIDYDLIDKKADAVQYQNFLQFSEYVTQLIMQEKSFVIKLERKVITHNNCILIFKEVTS